MQLCGDLKPFAQPYLDLEYEASEPFVRFVYDSRDEAVAIQQRMFDDGLGEFCAPYGRVLLHEGHVIGMAAWLSQPELLRSRLRLAQAFSRWKLLESRERQDRLQRAATVLIQPERTDLYLSRLAVAPAFRGRGLARFLIQECEADARRRGCRRVVLDVSLEHEAAWHAYRRLGFEEFGTRRIVSADGTRSLEYRHLARPVAQPAAAAPPAPV